MRHRTYTKLTLLSLFAVASVFVGASLSEAADRGQRAFLREGCDRCHAISSLGIEARDPEEEAPDMSNAGADVESAEWIEKWVLREVEKEDGTKHSRPYEGSKKRLQLIAEWLMTLETS